MRNNFFKAIYELAEKDDKIVFITGDLGYKLYDPFAKRFPDRFLNAGVAEANMVGVAAGLALEGFKPFIYSIVPFATLRCFEQIRNDIVMNNLNVKIVGVGGGYAYGHNGPTHHAIEDVAVMRTLPNMTIVAPGDPQEAYRATHALGEYVGPGYLRLSRSGEPAAHKDGLNFQLGKAIVINDGNDDTCILSTGSMLSTAIELGDKLKKWFGYSPTVISVPTIKPLDKETILKHCSKSSLVVVLEEHSVVGGFYSAIAEWFIEDQITIPVKHFGIPDFYTKDVGDQDYLKNLVGLSAEKMCYNTLDFVGKQEI